MYIVIFCSILAILFTYLETLGRFKNGMLWGFIFVTLLQAIHYDYGNDYLGYYATYLNVIQFDLNWLDIINEAIYREPGWALLNYAFKPFGDYGFFVLVAVISVFEGIVYYKMIRRYVNKEYWAFAVLIYLFSTSFYLMNFSMLRQGFVVTVFLALWPLIERRKVFIPLFIVYLLSFIHSSGIFLLPFVFWGYIPMNRNTGKLWVFIFMVLLLGLYISKDFLNNILSLVISTSEDFSEKADYYGSTKYLGTRGLGFVIGLIPLVISLLYVSNKLYAKSDKQIVLLSCLGFIIAPFAELIPLITRVGTYFSVFTILTVPIVYGAIENKTLRFFCTFLYLFVFIYAYITFFKSPVWIDKFGGDFKTIFSVI